MVTESKRVIVNIDAMGNAKVEAVGYNGVGCEAATKPIEDALAGGTGGIDRVMKPEWYEAEEETQKLTW